ncbi:MAG: 4Fe-4S dicluster domain-containing protein [Desulfovibrio sp.]|jgi:Fe-S-cluster-containing hydrogenase component 2|nr:4Fe-4S dicluster domain-containing protein [Desulfovibrio sp.]
MNEKNNTPRKGGITRRRFLEQTALAAAALPLAAQAAKAAQAPAPAPAAPPAKPKMRYLFAERASCTGCRACEYACSQFHEKGVTRPALSRIHITRYKGIVDVPNICWHCEDAPCIASCPTTPKAIRKVKETNGIEFIDDKTCLGAKCNKCIEACPPKYLRRNPDTGWPLFCDLCGGDPECVKACENIAQQELAPALVTKPTGGGVNLTYRDVTGDEAAESLIQNFYFPNNEGGR